MSRTIFVKFETVKLIGGLLYTGLVRCLPKSYRRCTLNMDISFGNGNSILKLLRGVSHSQIEFDVGIQFQTRSKLDLFSLRMEMPFRFILNFSECGIYSYNGFLKTLEIPLGPP